MQSESILFPSLPFSRPRNLDEAALVNSDPMEKVAILTSRKLIFAVKVRRKIIVGGFIQGNEIYDTFAKTSWQRCAEGKAPVWGVSSTPNQGRLNPRRHLDT